VNLPFLVKLNVLFVWHLSFIARLEMLRMHARAHTHSESELCGGAVVSFSKYLPWQAMHLLQRSTHFSEM
jgi:hypothetical protein